jgi:hypothetical protein
MSEKCETLGCDRVAQFKDTRGNLRCGVCAGRIKGGASVELVPGEKPPEDLKFVIKVQTSIDGDIWIDAPLMGTSIRDITVDAVRQAQAGSIVTITLATEETFNRIQGEDDGG